MRVFKALSTFILTFLLSIVLSSTAVNAQVGITGWELTTPLPYTEASHDGFSNNGKIFIFGGSNTSGGSHNEVLRGNTDSSGNVTSWDVVSTTPKKLIWHSVTHNQNYAYVLGGFLDNIGGVSAVVNEVSFATINTDNTFSSWQTTENLPQTLVLGGAVVVGSKIYYAGGNTLPTYTVNSSITNSNIYMAEINADGTLGSWSIAGTMPQRLIGFGLLEKNNYLYILGGKGESGNLASVRRALISTDGSIGVWETLEPLPKAVWRLGSTKVEDTMVVTGGESTLNDGGVYTTKIKPDGTIEPWNTEVEHMPNFLCCAPLVSWGNKIYFIGGYDFQSGYSSKVFVATIEQPTPPPTPTPSPITSKVVLIPGTGASWNLDAFINCKDTGYIGGWTLAPYAEKTYKPLLDSLSNTGWQTLPFYYDWRQDIRENEPLVSEFINSETSTGEKVNVLGHSMGGLLGRKYIESQLGGRAEKFLSIGTPNRGSALAYPIFSGHEPWGNDLVDTIAKTLFVKHCGTPASIQNLLPTDNYLRDVSNGNLKEVTNMYAQNNLLPTSFASPFWGVKVGTLAGSGFPTLKIINVKNPSKGDIKNGVWLDGKPIGKGESNQGDGTVLLESAQVPGAESNSVINQTHSGLVASTEGISSILGFLGTPTTSTLPFVEPTSALVVVGSPSNFWINDESGKMYPSNHGMVSILNPKGKYKLQNIPSAYENTFIEAQFLPNNRVLYKERKLKGLQTSPSYIDFGVE